MTIDTGVLVAMTDANQNFSSVVRKVDENGMAVILRNNKPRYVIVGFEEYEEIQHIREVRAKQISKQADQLIAENLEAFKELAK